MMHSLSQSFLKHRLLNDWGLFSLVVTLISALVVIPLAQIDTTNPADISGMIQQSVRLAVPWIFIAFASSSLVKVFPNKLTKWVMRNRRIFGLCFAAGMAWQLFFILWMVFGHFDYYMAEAYSYYDLSEQIPGYIILAAMTLTSFKFGRGWLSGQQWRMLHKGGIYFLWYVVWSTYWFELYYYEDIQTVDHIFYWLGMAAWGIRLIAWNKKRAFDQKQITFSEQSQSFSLNAAVVGTCIALGLTLLAVGHIWAPVALGIIPASAFGGWLELFVPLLPMGPLLIASLAGKQ